MNYRFEKNYKISVIDLKDSRIGNRVIEMFLKKDDIIYITKNGKYFGTITYEQFRSKNFDVFLSIDKDYSYIIDSQLNENKLNEILSKNSQLLNVPVCDADNHLVFEYRKVNGRDNQLSINKERWNYLYNENNKIIEYLHFNKINKIIVIGKLKTNFKKYVQEFSNIRCELYSGNIFKLINSVDEKTTIIDTDNLYSELIEYIINFQFNTSNKMINYTSINELCDNAELFHFSKFIKLNKIKVYFFLCQTPEQLNNLNFFEKLRISFDKHYRYYLENMNKSEEINSIVKKVLGDLYTTEFINSRNSMSGTILKNGVCYLAPSNNQFCKVLKGLRYTTDHNYETNYKINMFGPCLFFGPLQDDERTIPSYIQRSINDNNKDYWVYNYGQRAISMYENIRTCNTIELRENDVLIFAISPEEKRKLVKYGIDNTYSIADMLNQEPNFHDYFMGEPIHCNHIANEKIAQYIYNIIKPELVSIDDNIKHNEIVNEGKKISIFSNNADLKKYINDLKKTYKNNNGVIGAVMMNCNPFTKGHYNLIKFASSKVDKLYVFVVQEDKSYFSFKDRIEMVRLGCHEFSNVFVVGSGKVFGSYITFPAYFHRDNNPNIEIDVSMDIELFTEYIAPALNIKKRFVGEEPIDNVTRNYNSQIKKELPKFGIEFIEIPRFQDDDGQIISAKYVRKALEEDEWEKVKNLVPDSILQVLEKYRKYEKVL